jgi:hypothetical protein
MKIQGIILVTQMSHNYLQIQLAMQGMRGMHMRFFRTFV